MGYKIDETINQKEYLAQAIHSVNEGSEPTESRVITRKTRNFAERRLKKSTK